MLHTCGRIYSFHKYVQLHQQEEPYLKIASNETIPTWTVLTWTISNQSTCIHISELALLNDLEL